MKIPLRFGAAILAFTILGTACGAASPASTSTTTSPRASATSTAASSTAVTTKTKAADLRTTLNVQLSDHVYLAGFAVAEALLGNDPGFQGGAKALDQNSVELSKSIGSVYGPDAEKRFLELWRAHIGMFVAYTQGAAAKDQAKMAKAKTDLDGYRADFDAFLSGANPNLPKGAVAQLLVPHVQHLIATIDAIAAGDLATGFDTLKTAADHSQKIADPLSAAITKQFPDKLTGDGASKAIDTRIALNNLLNAHVYLAGLPVRMALAGSDPGFKAGAATLDKNSVELSKAIGSFYGADAEKRFLELWRAHIGMFVAYTQAAAKNDTAAKQKALTDLDGYRKDFDAFITGANPNLPKGAVAELLVEHVSGIAKAIDLLATKDYAGAYPQLKLAAGHSMMIADPLAEAIVKQFPDKVK
ncbi:MAG: hypothetical protein M3R54_12630 [Chloroflexota bacterium]|nr:hypothetical protein [Chloroflexota bacterium]